MHLKVPRDDTFDPPVHRVHKVVHLLPNSVFGDDAMSGGLSSAPSPGLVGTEIDVSTFPHGCVLGVFLQQASLWAGKVPKFPQILSPAHLLAQLVESPVDLED